MSTSSQRCTCCHICHTSVKTSRRNFIPCTTCQSIICQPCIELTGQNYDSILMLSTWSCPRCCNNCPCKRCRNKLSKKSDYSPTTSTSVILSSSQDKHRQKRRRTTSIIDESSYSPSKISKTSLKLDAPSTFNQSTVNKSTLKSSGDDQLNRITELRSKNQQCIEYILRTERLLALIRSEQDRIAEELSIITANCKEKCSPSYQQSSNQYDNNNDIDYYSEESSDIDEYVIESPGENENHPTHNYSLQSLVDHIHQHELVSC